MFDDVSFLSGCLRLSTIRDMAGKSTYALSPEFLLAEAEHLEKSYVAES